MNTLIQESIKYAANTNPHKYESIQDALADAYAHGRLAKPCEDEIQSVVQYSNSRKYPPTGFARWRKACSTRHANQ